MEAVNTPKKTKTKPDIGGRVRAAGVVGAGGAGFPTWKKLAARVETVIANGAECEPLLRNDRAVMRRHPERVVAGLEAAMTAVGARRGVIALKRHYREAAEALGAAVRGKRRLSLHFLPEVYPAGDEFVLVYEVTGRVIPAGGLPLQVGVVVNNVETLYNVSRAVEGIPVTGKHLTVTGAVAAPKTLHLPVGTSVGEAVALAGGSLTDPWVALEGGPMMGAVVEDPRRPITKTTSALIVLAPDHPVVERKTRDLVFDLRQIQSACCQCSYCTLVCPRALLGHTFKPHLVMRSLALGFAPLGDGVSHAAACCACDLCGVYSCPMLLAVGRLNREVAAGMKERNLVPPPQPREPRPLPLREASLIPVERLTARLGLGEYDRPLPHDETAYRPQSVTLPLRQHIGRPARPTVKEGDAVEEGECVADLPPGEMGAPIHASIAGRVTRVTDAAVTIAASTRRKG